MTKEITRCEWCGEDPLYIRYHDEEWGVPVHDDQKHFEFIVLESAQAGLSWITILRKRENYRKAYDNFDPEKVALYDENKIMELLGNEGIIRNQLKIRSSVTNAKLFLEIKKEYGSFDKYFRSFLGQERIINHYEKLSELQPRTETSDRISKDMKKRGFKFMGSTIVYAHMQAAGLVNDHVVSCFRYNEV